MVIDRQEPNARRPYEREDLEGRQIEHYVVGKLLGEGGMARVYRAVDTANGRDVAFKVFKAPYRGDEAIQAASRAQAQSMARIRHDHVVRIFGLTDSAGPAGHRHGAHARRVPSRAVRPAGPNRKLGLDVPEAVALAAQAARGWARPTGWTSSIATSSPPICCFDHEGRIKVADFGAIRVVEEATWVTDRRPADRHAGLHEPGAVRAASRSRRPATFTRSG